MAREFTDDDRGKSVVTNEGNRVGTVDDVDSGRARVSSTDEEDQDLTDKIKDWLDWGDDREDRELRDEHVESYDENEVRLRDHR